MLNSTVSIDNEDLSIRIFVASTVPEWLPARVLEFSIRETSALPVQLRRIASFDRFIPMPRDQRNRPRTPFSFQRFLVPELCGYQGRAIYLDADMQLFDDIRELWITPMLNHDLLTVNEVTKARKGQFSVMLLDCERLRWRVESIVQGLDDGKYSYEQLMHEMCIVGSVGVTLDAGWNSLEKFDLGRTRLLHYTNMHTQPWVSLNNPLRYLWVDCLRRSIGSGFITEEELAREIAAGHVRPSLMVELKRSDAGMGELCRVDSGFVAPYKSLRSSKVRPRLSWRSLLAYLLRLS